MRIEQLSYLDIQNKIGYEDKQDKSLLFEIERIGNLFKKDSKMIVYNIFKNNETMFKNQNKSCIIFFIYLFLIQNNISKNNAKEIYQEYNLIFMEALKRYSEDIDLRIVFLTYLEITLNMELNKKI